MWPMPHMQRSHEEARKKKKKRRKSRERIILADTMPVHSFIILVVDRFALLNSAPHAVVVPPVGLSDVAGAQVNIFLK